MLALTVLSLWTSALLVGGAWIADRLVRSLRLPTRSIWALSMLASLGLVVAIPLRAAIPERTASDGPAMLAPIVVRGVDAALSGVTRSLLDSLPGWTNGALLALWMGASFVALALVVSGLRQQRRVVASATRASLEGIDVGVHDTFGPAVVGLRRPVIIVPRWLLDRSADERRLVLAHERAHLDASDPALLVLAAGVVVLLAWNPLLWWAFDRLRLATELDCDARVLRAGTPTDRYGTLLIDLTAALRQPRFGVNAFAARPSQLEQRLIAMSIRPVGPGRRIATILAAVLVTMTAGVSACTADVRTETPAGATDTVRMTAEAPAVLTVPPAEAVPGTDPFYFDFQTTTPAKAIPGVGAPRYPEMLRNAGMEGEVLAQFIVDTTGRIDIASFKQIRKTHDLFEASVRFALPAMRFEPATLDGRKVRQLVQTPFVFTLAK